MTRRLLGASGACCTSRLRQVTRLGAPSYPTSRKDASQVLLALLLGARTLLGDSPWLLHILRSFEAHYVKQFWRELQVSSSDVTRRLLALPLGARTLLVAPSPAVARPGQGRVVGEFKLAWQN